MKTTITFISLSVALSCAAPALLPAASENTHPMMFHVSSIQRDGDILVADGTSSSSVIQQLGRPMQRLSNNVWVYYQFRGNLEDAVNHECDTILITIENDHVASIALVNKLAKNVAAKSLAGDQKVLTRMLATTAGP